MLMDLIGLVFDVITYIMWGVLIALILSHIISRIYLATKKKLRLNDKSLVVITGGCMGIGK